MKNVMKQNKLLLSAVIIFSSLLIPASSILAQEPANTSAQNVRARLEESAENRCNLITTRVDTLVARYDNNKNRHINNYNRIKDRTQTLAARLQSKGYDTKEVGTNLQTLDTYIKNISQDYTKFVSALRESKEMACGQSEGAYRAKLQEARDYLKDVRESALETRNFVQTTLRPSIQELRDQKPTKS